MRSRDRLAFLVTIALLVVLLTSLAGSIVRRANATFDYPSYSSLNNSDLGLKAFHDALLRLGYRAERNFQPLHKLAASTGTIFYAGPSLQSFRAADRADLELFEMLSRAGSRVVLLLSSNGFRESASKGGPANNTLKEKWTIEVEGKAEPFIRDRTSRAGLPRAIYSFKAWSSEWRSMRIENGRPMMLERKFGKGSVLLVDDLEDFTNRQLLIKPNGELLTAVLGLRGRIVFDESHLGVADTGTVAGLARAHRLQWVLLGLTVLASLYVWRSTISFVAPSRVAEDDRVAGQDAYSALSHLLAQSVAPDQLLAAVAREWNASHAIRGRRTHDVTDSSLLNLSKVPEASVVRRYNRLARDAAGGNYTESSSAE